MDEWHTTKLGKYTPLVNKIEEKGWHAELFAVEVGARGYCSSSVTSCLRRHGFPTKSSNRIAKVLSSVAIHASFVIWLSRKSYVWEEQSPKPTTNSFPTPLTSTLPLSEPSRKKLPIKRISTKIKRPGFVNMLYKFNIKGTFNPPTCLVPNSCGF